MPLAPEDINNAAVPDHHATQLSRYLLLRSEANANTLIKASQERDEHPLETWRILSHEYDPKGLGSELAEIQNLTAPSKLRAKSAAGISMAIEAWEALERRHKDRHDLSLPDKLRISILFKLIPEDLAKDILKQTTKWASHTALRDHLLAIQYNQTNGPAPMLYNLEEPDDTPTALDQEITDEDGELLRLERRNGKTVAVKPKTVKAKITQQKQAGKETECYACGRRGHFARDCHSKKHKDGGPIRSGPAPRKAASNLEEEEESDPKTPSEIQRWNDRAERPEHRHRG